MLATDVLPKATESLMLYLPGVDPDVETFELVAVYPIECVNLSIFHRKKRQSLKARFSNNKVLYFELGGFEKRWVSIYFVNYSYCTTRPPASLFKL